MSTVWTTILVAGAGTYAMRASFLAFAHRLVAVPPWVQRVLRQIPPAALASIILPALVHHGGSFDLWNARVGAALLASVVAWRTRNVGLTLIVGMAALLLLQAVP